MCCVSVICLFQLNWFISGFRSPRPVRWEGPEPKVHCPYSSPKSLMGTEAAIHALHEFRSKNWGAEKVFVKIDFSNAFNCVHRGAFIEATTGSQLENWVRWCYGRQSWLLFGKHALSSAEGAQQGDPLGPMLFSLALKPVLVEVLKTSPEFA